MQFGDDPMDSYSVPLKAERTKLAQIFTLKLRAKPEKPGRAVAVVWDGRQPLVEGFESRYSYVVRFGKRGDLAANHYHRLKQEMYYAVSGAFKVVLEDIATKEREEFELQQDDNTCLYVHPGIAHAVICQTDGGVLLVTASRHEATDDELPYKVV